MLFSYPAYVELLKLLQENHYTFCNYLNYSACEKPVILRHDIDVDIRKAVEMARLEYEQGVSSTYYVLITSDFYNPFSKSNAKLLASIMDMGHDVGLHFDEEKYDENEDVLSAIENEVELLERYLGRKVTSVSMHRPSAQTLAADYRICGGNVVNSYGTEFFKNFKYLSDSRRCWREDVTAAVCSGQYRKLHILTHPVWYSKEERSAKDVLRSFCREKKTACYETLKDNIRDLEEILSSEEL